jgi:DNA-binding MarR family transcriptional regulator
MGLDQHRAQITAEWLDTATGEISRARIAPADRGGVRRFAGRFRGQQLEVALEATTGWRFVVEELTTYLLSLSGREARRRVAARVPLAEFALLAALDERGPVSQRTLGERLRKDPADMVRLVDAAESSGLVARSADPSDRRRRLVSLTPEGSAALRSHFAAAGDVEDSLLAPLDGGERRVLHSLLSRLPR